MEAQAGLYKPGTRVFVSNPKRGANQPEYVVATVVERASDGQVSVEIPNGSKQLRVMKPLTEVPLCEKTYLGDKMSDEFQVRGRSLSRRGENMGFSRRYPIRPRDPPPTHLTPPPPLYPR